MGRGRSKNNALLGALVSSALAAGAFTAPPITNASCFSAFGLSNGNGCTSNLTTLAIGIGDGAVANAGNALFGGAVAIGNNSYAITNIAGFTFAGAFGNGATASTLSSLFGLNLQFGPGTASTLNGVLNLVLGINPGGVGTSVAGAIGLGNVAIQLGPGSSQTLGGFNLSLGLPGGGSGAQQTGASGLGNIVAQIGAGIAQTVGFFNVALSIVPNGSGTQSTVAGLLGSFALNLFGDAGSVVTQSYFASAINILGANNVLVQGLLSAAASVFGTGNTITMSGAPLAPLSFALNLLGDHNNLTALYGPLSIVASVFQQAQTLVQKGLGININHFPGALFPHTAAATSSRPTAAAADKTPATATAQAMATDGTTGTTTTTVRDISGSKTNGTAGSGRHRGTETASRESPTTTTPSYDGPATVATGGRHRKAEASSNAGDGTAKSASARGVGGGKHRKQ